MVHFNWRFWKIYWEMNLNKNRRTIDQTCYYTQILSRLCQKTAKCVMTYEYRLSDRFCLFLRLFFNVPHKWMCFFNDVVLTYPICPLSTYTCVCESMCYQINTTKVIIVHWGRECFDVYAHVYVKLERMTRTASEDIAWEFMG